MRTLVILAAALLATTALTAAQTAGFSTFGTGCALPTARTTPQLTNTGTPRLGSVMAINYSGPNTIEPGLNLSDQPMLVFGARRIDLPFPLLTASQPNGCTLYPSPDAIVPMRPDTTGISYVSSFPLAIPNDPSLMGGMFFVQWATPHTQCFFVGCGLGWVVLSNAGVGTIGT